MRQLLACSALSSEREFRRVKVSIPQVYSMIFFLVEIHYDGVFASLCHVFRIIFFSSIKAAGYIFFPYQCRLHHCRGSALSSIFT